MRQLISRGIVLGSAILMAGISCGAVAEDDPRLPRFEKIQLRTWVIPSSDNYLRYSYAVTNHHRNNSSIREIGIDITSEFGQPELSSANLTIPQGSRKVALSQYSRRFSNGSFKHVVPVGLESPNGWKSDLTINDGGYAVFSSGGRTDKNHARIRPGKTQGNFFIISQGLPTIRDVEVIPHWTYQSKLPGQPSAIEQLETEELETKAIHYTWALGPSGIKPGTPFHMDLIYSGIYRSIEIGWIKNRQWGNRLAREISGAKYALEEGKRSKAQQGIIRLLNLVQQSDSSQRADEFFTFMYLNLRRFLETM